MNLEPKRKIRVLVLFTLSFLKIYRKYISSANVMYKLLLNVLSLSLFYSTEKNNLYSYEEWTIFHYAVF